MVGVGFELTGSLTFCIVVSSVRLLPRVPFSVMIPSKKVYVDPFIWSSVYLRKGWIIETVSTEGFTPKIVANLWTEFAAHRSQALATNGKELQNP